MLKIVLISSALLLFISQSHAAMVWQPLPKQKPPVVESGPPAQGQTPRRGAGKPFRLIDGEGAVVQLWTPSLTQTPVDLKGDKVKASSGGIANYHALVALHDSEHMQQAALRYVYMHGRPSGESPSKLVSANKLDLEIMPDPLPREHWRYESKKAASFVIKWQGMPLANTPVTLSTSNGTELTLQSNKYGFINLVLPDDFTEIKAGRKGNKPAEWLLTVEHQQGGKQYQTTLSAAYYVSPSHWQSNQLALWMMGFGFIGGLGLVRLLPRATKKGKKSC